MNNCLINVSIIREFNGTLADIPSDELMPFNDKPSKEDIMDFWTSEGIAIITNSKDLEEFKKYIAWELYDYSEFPRVLNKTKNIMDVILNNNLLINFNLQSLIIVIGALIKNVYYSPNDCNYHLEFDQVYRCYSNAYFGYQIEARGKSKRMRLLNQKLKAIDDKRILNFNEFPLKKNVKLYSDVEENEKAMKDYLCYLQSQNTINNINLELLNKMLNNTNYQNQVLSQNAEKKISFDNIERTISNYKEKENKNIFEELHSELKSNFQGDNEDYLN